MTIDYSPRFKRLYKKLPFTIKEMAEIRERIFLKDPFDSRLKTHKLSGDMKNYWAFSIDHKYRIIFSFVSNRLVRFHAVGDHSIYN
ncbi:MAG: type II toxin-antitoxin system mRNA interferase toxin, RelE/StbE family [Patescibacteria group bacterium]